MNSDATHHLFIGSGKQQELAAREIAQAEFSAADTGQYLSFGKTLPTLNHAAIEIVDLSSAGAIEYRRNARRFRLLIRSLAARETALRVYLPHPYYYPGNAVLFALTNASKWLIPDGMINYADYHVSPARTPSMLLRWAVANALGIRFHLYSGHITAFESGLYSGCYAFSATALHTVLPEIRLLQLKVNSLTRPETDPQECLFLDHFLQDVPRPLREQAKELAHQTVRQSQFSRLLYKPHPSWNPKNSAILGRIPCTTLAADVPIENLAGQLSAGTIMSFASSALLTLKEMNPGLRCIAIGPEAMWQLAEYRDLYRVFESRGVEIITRLP